MTLLTHSALRRCSLALTLLALPAAAEVQVEFHPGTVPVRVTATAKPQQLATGPAVILPFYYVETNDTSGETTLYAVRNNSAEPITVRYRYFRGTSQTAVLVEDLTLAAHAVRTVNLRNVQGLPTGNNPVATGFMVAEVTNSALPAAVISGDYFRYEPPEAANGGALLPVSAAECRRWSHRFFSGGAFGGTSQIAFLVQNRPAEGPVVAGNVFDEAGNQVGTVAITSDQVAFEMSNTDLQLPVNFGSIEWVFQGDAHGVVTSTFTAGGNISVGTEAACIEGINDPPPTGTVTFELPGTFLTCRRCANWQYDMPFAEYRQFARVVVDFEVSITTWDPDRPNGFHCIFWLNNGQQWQDMMAYMNSRGTQNRVVFQSNGPLGNPIGVETYSSPGLAEGQTYRVHYEYDTIAKVVGYEIRTLSGQVHVADFVDLPSDVGLLGTSYTFIQFGSQPGGPVESLTEGWSWSNFRAQFIP